MDLIGESAFPRLPHGDQWGSPIGAGPKIDISIQGIGHDSVAQLPNSEATQWMRYFLEAPPDVFHHDSSIPPPYSNPENHCNNRNLSDKRKESRGWLYLFKSLPKLNQ